MIARTKQPGSVVTDNPEQYLQNRVALITGDLNGIGKATCRALADRGRALAIGARTVENGFVEELRGRGVRVFAESPGITMEYIQVNAGALW